jgi:protein required for attachment to host cells
MVQGGDWVVVCDGKKALVLENVGDTKSQLKTRRSTSNRMPRPASRDRRRLFYQFHHAALWSRPIGMTRRRSDFQRLASRLDAEVNAGNAKSVIIVALPRAPACSQAYSQNLRNVLRAEIDKDFVRMPVNEIEKHLAA